jgi:hypothetical protein
MPLYRRNKKVVVTRTQYRPPHDRFPFAFSLSPTSSRLVHASEPRERMPNATANAVGTKNSAMIVLRGIAGLVLSYPSRDDHLPLSRGIRIRKFGKSGKLSPARLGASMKHAVGDVSPHAA